MAEKKPNHNAWLGRLAGSASEARGRLAEDRRERETEGKRKDSIILTPKDIRSGVWDASRILNTTLGGKLRKIEREDLPVFQRNMDTARAKLGIIKQPDGSYFQKGITARQIINLSREVDRERTYKTYKDRGKEIQPIRQAVPVSASGGLVKFITSAGGSTKGVVRHHVSVEFLNFTAEASTARKTDRAAALSIKKGPLKFDCDCKHHRFFLRYISTIGGFNAGRPETGFPKIRNPGLDGVACKHVLRVMAEIETGGSPLAFLTRHVAKIRASDSGAAISKMAQRDAERTVKNQALRTTGAEVRYKDIPLLKKAAEKAVPLKKIPPRTRKPRPKPMPPGDMRAALEAELRQTLAALGLEPTPDQINTYVNARMP